MDGRTKGRMERWREREGERREGRRGVGRGAGAAGTGAAPRRRSPRNLVDAARARVGLDEERVGRVVHDDGSALLRQLDQVRQLLPRGGGPRGVVGRAHEDEVRARRRGVVGPERVAGVAGQVLHALEPGAVRSRLPRHAHEHAGVDVDGVGGVLHRHGGARPEHHLEAADVALGPVGDEDLARLDRSPGVEALGDGLAQRGVALLGAVPGVAVGRAHARGARDEAGRDGRRDGLSRVADAEADDLGVGVLREVGGLAAVDLGEEIAGLELGDVGVAADGGGTEGDGATAGRAGRRRGAAGRGWVTRWCW